MTDSYCNIPKGMNAIFSDALDSGGVELLCCPVRTAVDIAEKNGVKIDMSNILMLLKHCAECEREWSGGCE